VVLGPQPSDETSQTSFNQSRNSNSTFSQPEVVSGPQKEPWCNNQSALDQSASSSQVTFSGELSEDDEERDHTGWKKSWGLRRQFGDHPRAVWRPPSEPATDAIAPFDDPNNDKTNASACWPSKTGMRRGNPKSTYNEDGTLKATCLARRDERGGTPDTSTGIPLARPVKRKTNNEFGESTFWNRPAAPKRKHKTNSSALMAISPTSITHGVIVNTGASHVLFQAKHTHLLLNVQMSSPTSPPFAVLRAANGQILTAIGKGMLYIKHIGVVAFIFRDDDLVHNLLGIAPFADLGCTAVFKAQKFTLYHGKTSLITGQRHSANLWQISLESPTMLTCPPGNHRYGRIYLS
jgi:hypothetical protein